MDIGLQDVLEMPLVRKFITFYLQLTKLHFLFKATKPLGVQSHKAEHFFCLS